MWPCSRRGFPSTPGHPGIWWALTPPFHPCPCGRSSFLWHYPWGRPLSRFGTALPCGARTFLPPLPGSNHLTRSEIKERLQKVNCKVQISKGFISPSILHFAFCTLHFALKFFIYCLVRQSVRFLVPFPRDVLYLNASDFRNQFFRLSVQRLQTFVLYLILSV